VVARAALIKVKPKCKVNLARLLRKLSPCFESKRACVRRSNVGRMWLSRSSEFTAKVRLLGRSTMLTRDLGYSDLAGAGDAPADRRYSTAHNWEVDLLGLPPKKK
jgi:hypothetical protein